MSKALKKQEALDALALPDFMQDDQNIGVEDLGKFVVPPRVKVLQPLSDRDTFLTTFDPGDVIAVPQKLLIAPMEKNEAGKNTDEGKPFFLTPLFFFPEWVTWNPLSQRGILNAVRDRTLDPSSPIAVKSRTPATWSESCPEEPTANMRHIEHLNFVALLFQHPELQHIPVILSFSRAEHRAGSNFASLIKMRKAPLFGCQFEARVGSRKNSKGHWFGIDVTNPSGDSGVAPFVQDKETYEFLKSLHEEYKTAHEEAKLRVDYEDDSVDAESSAVEDSEY